LLRRDDRVVPRQRRLVPITPFGIWLDQWLQSHPDWTYEDFGAEVGVTKTSITNWVGAQKPVKVPVQRLRRIARATATDVTFLEKLVYGEEAQAAPAPAPEWLAVMRAEIAAGVAEGVTRVLDRLVAEGRLPGAGTAVPQPRQRRSA
jgi:hypothetical protein